MNLNSFKEELGWAVSKLCESDAHVSSCLGKFNTLLTAARECRLTVCQGFSSSDMDRIPSQFGKAEDPRAFIVAELRSKGMEEENLV